MNSFGIDINGNTIPLENMIGKIVKCSNKNLVELYLDEAVTMVMCRDNKFKSLSLPDGIRYLSCDKELFDYDACEIDSVHIYYITF